MRNIEETAAGIGSALIVLGVGGLCWLGLRWFVMSGLAQVWWPI